MKKKEIDGIMENKTLLNILSPIGGIEYKKNYIKASSIVSSIKFIGKRPMWAISSKDSIDYLEDDDLDPNSMKENNEYNKTPQTE